MISHGIKKKTKLIDTESIVGCQRWGWGQGEIGEGGQKVLPVIR